MSPVPPPAPATSAQIADALRALGKGNGMHAAGNRARVLLETIPQDVLVAALTDSWQKENIRCDKRLRVILVLYGLCLLLPVTLGLLLFFVDRDTWKQPEFTRWVGLIWLTMPLSVLALSPLLFVITIISRLRVGIARMTFLRPHWQFMPLVIDSLFMTNHLASAERTDPIAYNEKQHALLTTLLPLWCSEDTLPITRKQHKILLNELKQVAFRGVGINRNILEPTAPLSEAEADFCLAAITVLRRNATTSAVSNLDKSTRAALKNLPDATSNVDINRQYVQEAAQALLSQSR